MINEMINKVAQTDKEIADAITAEYERLLNDSKFFADNT